MTTCHKILMENLFQEGFCSDTYYPKWIQKEVQKGETRFVSYHGEIFHKYFVNKSGKIFSMHRYSYLNPTIDNSNGYFVIRLRNDEKAKKMLLHRIMAEAFIPLKKPSPKISDKDWEKCPQSIKSFIMQNMQVNHIDHDRSNCDLKNLEWVTAEQNARKAVEFYNA